MRFALLLQAREQVFASVFLLQDEQPTQRPAQTERPRTHAPPTALVLLEVERHAQFAKQRDPIGVYCFGLRQVLEAEGAPALQPEHAARPMTCV